GGDGRLRAVVGGDRVGGVVVIGYVEVDVPAVGRRAPLDAAQAAAGPRLGLPDDLAVGRVEGVVGPALLPDAQDLGRAAGDGRGEQVRRRAEIVVGGIVRHRDGPRVGAVPQVVEADQLVEHLRLQLVYWAARVPEEPVVGEREPRWAATSAAASSTS